MTAPVHRGRPYFDGLQDDTLLSFAEIDAVREKFGHLTGSQIEAEFGDRQGNLDTAQAELGRLIPTWEAAARCSVAEATVRGWVHRKKLSPAEYRDGVAYFRQIDVHRANQSSKARAATLAREPEPRFTDRDEALNQLAAAVALCLEAGITDLPVLVQDIVDDRIRPDH